MVDCRLIEPLLVEYVDGDIASGRYAVVESHLAACPRCRMRVAGERAAREVLHRRRAALSPCASVALRKRCAECACGHAGFFGRLRNGRAVRQAVVPLSLAATVVLAVTAAFLFGGDSVEALANQLAFDHVKCFHVPSFHGPVDAAAAGDAWTRNYGWALTVPRSAPVEGLELVDVRRCLSMHGFTAHIMYKWRGNPLSLYVMNGVPSSDVMAERIVSRLGQETVIWAEGGRTYAVVSQGPLSDLERVAHHVRAAER